jgi:hypothetical protein
MSQPKKSKDIDPMEKAFRALQEIPDLDGRPEGSWTRVEFMNKHDLSKTRAQTAIAKMLENGIITVHDERGVGGAKYYTTIE